MFSFSVFLACLAGAGGGSHCLPCKQVRRGLWGRCWAGFPYILSCLTPVDPSANFQLDVGLLWNLEGLAQSPGPGPCLLLLQRGGSHWPWAPQIPSCLKTHETMAPLSQLKQTDFLRLAIPNLYLDLPVQLGKFT